MKASVVCLLLVLGVAAEALHR
ncbi:hypothetical protein E2C01_076064 [Portunus trituberculatus]|uniref:Uncharacterized protein n=2 Tax=Portuninae TaxID=600346 RepID=A0A5B7IL20_PORTR|nr:hypothetical protein [Portunus trituberculatus]